MNSEEYKELLLARLARYFNILPDGIYSGKRYDIAAEFSSRETHTALLKENVMDFLDSKEICLVSFGNTAESVTEELSALPSLAVSAAAPSRNHKSTVVTRIFAVTEAAPETVRSVTRFRFSKSFRFCFYGWTEAHAVLADLKSGRIWTSRGARRNRKVFAPV